ncbi:hypothetical protein ACHQM5_030344 [Ranunculus cassubicifolius]
MTNYACYGRVSRLRKPFVSVTACFYRFLVFQLNPFWIHLCYFVSISVMGFSALKILKPRTDQSYRPTDIEYFFTSVSSATVSSMSSVEMEVFSNSQLVFITVLMFVGGEVFTSALALHFAKYKSQLNKSENKVDATDVTSSPRNLEDSELGLFPVKSLEPKFMDLKYNSLRYLGYVMLGYLAVVLGLGSTLVRIYLTFVPSAGDILKTKGLKISTFTIFTVISTFTNCGFVPTNENMIVFKNNPGLLLLLIPQVLLGNTLFPSCLRFSISLLGMITRKEEFKYMLKYTREMQCHYLLPRLHSLLLVFTVLGFILVQFILFCSMEWNSGALDGMTFYQKIVGALFQAVNSRHTGESIVDLSIISPAVLVLFVVMMYLPPHTYFSPIKDHEQYEGSCEKKNKPTRHYLVENILFSPLCYLVIFVILVCITERKKIKDDPLNFSLLNIVIEVVSAYGNVGFSTGYSCKRQINPDSHCKDSWIGFSGRWSNKGKMILILVMFFGRLKNFSIGAGKAWNLS